MIYAVTHDVEQTRITKADMVFLQNKNGFMGIFNDHFVGLFAFEQVFFDQFQFRNVIKNDLGSGYFTPFCDETGLYFGPNL